MTSTPRSAAEESLNESWVEVNGSQVMGTPVHLLTRSGTHSFRSLERLLSEAQKESNQSSMRGSARNSHSISPKSAQSPVFPIESLSPNESVFLCKDGLMDSRSRQLSTDWIWDWSSRDHLPKEWNLNQMQPLRKSRMSLRQWAVRRGIFSKEVLSLLLLTNILSLLLGAGIGYTILVRRAL